MYDDELTIKDKLWIFLRYNPLTRWIRHYWVVFRRGLYCRYHRAYQEWVLQQREIYIRKHGHIGFMEYGSYLLNDARSKIKTDKEPSSYQNRIRNDLSTKPREFLEIKRWVVVIYGGILHLWRYP